MEMPAPRLASGSVRTRAKIQLAYWPSVCQTFCPLTTHSPSSSSPFVVRLKRSLPASGSEYPCAHRCSPLIIAGRKWAFCSGVPQCSNVGPIRMKANRSLGCGMVGSP